MTKYLYNKNIKKLNIQTITKKFQSVHLTSKNCYNIKIN